MNDIDQPDYWEQQHKELLKKYGLLEIQANGLQTRLDACEKALEERDATIKQLRLNAPKYII